MLAFALIWVNGVLTQWRPRVALFPVSPIIEAALIGAICGFAIKRGIGPAAGAGHPAVRGRRPPGRRQVGGASAFCPARRGGVRGVPLGARDHRRPEPGRVHLVGRRSRARADRRVPARERAGRTRPGRPLPGCAAADPRADQPVGGPELRPRRQRPRRRDRQRRARRDTRRRPGPVRRPRRDADPGGHEIGRGPGRPGALRGTRRRGLGEHQDHHRGHRVRVPARRYRGGGRGALRPRRGLQQGPRREDRERLDGAAHVGRPARHRADVLRVPRLRDVR